MSLLKHTCPLAVLFICILIGQTNAQWSHDPNANNPVSVVAGNDQSLPKIIGDGAGGTIIVWLDNRSGNNDIYAQRINATGARQWLSGGNYDGVPICSIPSSQHDIVIVSDGTGGAIITWDDKSNNFDLDIYAQRVDGSGVVQWASSGVPISTLVDGIYPSNQEYPTIASDGAGGAIIVWLDTRNYYTTGLDIYAQRINANGVRQWANGSDSNGVAISTAIHAQLAPEIVSDGAGGAIITWYDARNDSVHSDVYAQRINASGFVQWTTNGVAVCTATDQQQNPQIISDGTGGAIIAWEDFRNGTSYDIYAQHINASGVRQWAVGVDLNGVAVSTAANDQSVSAIVSDGAAGAIVVWQDFRSGTSDDIYAQHLSAGGTRQWIVGGDSNGVAVSTAPNDQIFPALVSDGAGGSVITWSDYRSGTSNDIYAQHLSASGSRQWIVGSDSNGVAVSTAPNGQTSSAIVSDGAGGSIITWSDYRNGTSSDIYAQWIDADGVLGGYAPALGLPSSSFNFGAVPTNLSKTDSVTVVSGGNVPLIISSVTSTSGDFTVMSSTDTIGVGQSRNFTMTFHPQALGARSGKIIFHSNASSSPDTVSVAGTGINPLYTITPSSIDFGFVPTDSTRYDSITVTCLNPSIFILSVSSVTSSDPYLTVIPTSASIPLNSSQVFHLTFHPTGLLVSRVDTITFFHNDFGSPNRVMCSAASVLTVVDSVQNGWNMISNPVAVTNDSVRVLFPNSTNAYAYLYSPTGYVQAYTMENGTGYWEKFVSVGSQNVTGQRITRDTLNVVAGWNMVGTISNAVDTSTIVAVPVGLRVSPWYGYGTTGYSPATQLVPGKAYWVKATGAGRFVLATGPILAKSKAAGGDPLSTLNSLTINDSKGGSQTLFFGGDERKLIQVGLYGMPPLPPVGSFDARFVTPGGGSLVQTHPTNAFDDVEFPVTIQSDAYPLTITWNVNKSTASYELTDDVGGRVFPAKSMNGEGSLKITNSNVTKFSVKLTGDGQLPKEFALQQNYPNPFNPSTTIRYDLPKDSRVNLKLFSILGQEVATLVNEEQKAGNKSVQWNASSVASGVYFYRLDAGSFRSVKKLLLLK